MRKIIFLSTIVIALIGSAFKPIAGLDDVINALKTGNAQELSKYIDDNVEISLPDKSDNYSRTQAVMVLKDFFNNNDVTGFDVQFKGENGGGQYCIGNLKTKSGVYRTTVFMKSKDGRQLIKEIRFKSS
jgi:antitoxin component YwqK of YwqJK toxin-antitoxin module